MATAARSTSPSWGRVFAEPPSRLASLDIYRGVVMALLISGGLGLTRVAKSFPENAWLNSVAQQLDHVAWEGCVLWDMIQPCFMFIVGVSMAFSLENRAERHSYFSLMLHAAWRAIMLVLLGIFVRSLKVSQTNFIFTDVLAQIGLGYFFVFLLWRQSRITQSVVALCVLLSYACFFYFYPFSTEFDYAQTKLPDGYTVLEGIRAHWNIHNNPAAKFDGWFLNLFPRSEPFQYNSGGYTTLNFIPAAITMLLGLMAGEWLRDDYSPQRRMGCLFIAGIIALGVSYVLHVSGACPIVKRIWTPSWTIYSAGWASIGLSLCYFLFDMANLQPIADPFIAIGRNSIAVYLMSYLLKPWLIASTKIHLGRPLFQWLAELGWVPLQVRDTWKTDAPSDIFALFGVYQPVAEQAFVLVVIWAIAVWLHRKKVYVKL
jgi:heparan-alpha-glucosaminide N-acetyltransferase